MGDILPFISRLVGRLDWSAQEKARLQQLADRLAQGDLDLEVVFGRSDEGEPWCAVTGPDQEVLVHIARIGGRFIVHHIAQDVLETGSSLWAAVEQALGGAWAEPPAPALAEVAPLESRQTHILSALIVAAVLVEAEVEPLLEAAPELTGPAPGPEAPPSEPPPTTDEDQPGSPSSRAAHEEAAKPSSGATKLALLAQDQADGPAPFSLDQSSGPPPAGRPAPPDPTGTASPDAGAAASSEVAALPRLIGGEHDDVLIGGEAAEVLIGGAGDDTLNGGGAPPDAFDWLHGGAGDDQLALAAQVVAAGGPGADRFVFTFPPDGEPSVQVLGRVLDFTPSQGDSLSLDGRPGVVVTASPEVDILDGTAPPPGFGGPGPLPGFRVGVDLDGDGRADGQVLLAGGEVGGFIAASLRGGAPPPPPEAAADPALRPPDADEGLFLL